MKPLPIRRAEIVHQPPPGRILVEVGFKDGTVRVYQLNMPAGSSPARVARTYQNVCSVGMINADNWTLVEMR